MMNLKEALKLPLKQKISIVRRVMFPLIHKRRFEFIGRQTLIEKTISLIGARNIRIGNYVTVLKNARIECIERWNNNFFSPKVTIGDGVSIGQSLHLTCGSGVTIGEGSMIANGVTITDISHDSVPYDEAPLARDITTKNVWIGKNVFVGAGACILPGSRIGDGSVVGANAVVCGLSTPPHSVIVGIPAKVVKVDGKKNICDIDGEL